MTSFGQESNDQSQPSATGVLTGDPATACKVILCLSSGKRPEECNPPLEQFFSISRKHWSDTVNARRDFLKLCPSSNDTSSTNMPALIDAMANGAGQCDPASLNRNIAYVQKETCEGYGEDRYCQTIQIPVINPHEPSYCVAYTTNSNTYDLGVQYVGDPLKGGHWVAVSQ